MSRQKREELSRRFFDAVMAGDTEGLKSLLAADVVAYGDGGGKAPAFPRPLYGRERVIRVLLGVSRPSARPNFVISYRCVRPNELAPLSLT